MSTSVSSSLMAHCSLPKTTAGLRFQAGGSLLLTGYSLRLNDSWSDEENQLLVLGVDFGVLEQVAEERQIAEQRNLRNIDRVLGLNDAADHHRAAIRHQHLRRCLLRDQFGVALYFLSEVWRGVFHVDVQEDGVLRSDLRSHRQPQERVHVGYGRRTAQLRLGHDRYTHTLLNQGLNVILRDHARTGEHFQQAARLGHRELEVQPHGVAGIEERQAARRLCDAQVREQRDRISRV